MNTSCFTGSLTPLKPWLVVSPLAWLRSDVRSPINWILSEVSQRTVLDLQEFVAVGHLNVP